MDFQEALNQSLQAQEYLQMKLTDLEAHSRHDNVRMNEENLEKKAKFVKQIFYESDSALYLKLGTLKLRKTKKKYVI